jgi:phosphate transport system substrate-binding protein
MAVDLRSVAAIATAIALIVTGCAPAVSASKQAQPQAAQLVKITGAATVYPALEALGAAAQIKTKGISLALLPANQTAGGISGAKEKLVDIGAVTRAPRPEESAGQLQYREIARDILMVGTHSSVTGVANLTTDQMKGIYSGTIKNWKDVGGPDAAIVVLSRAEDESATVLLRQHYLGKDLKITGQSVLLDQESELASTLRSTPYSIGALSVAYATAQRLPISKLSLDGVAPSVDNAAAGTYKMVRSLGIVWQDPPSPAAQQFLDFATSEAGSQQLRDSAFVPSAPNR